MKKILVVEDEKNIRETLVDILQIKGFEVHEADNGQVGLEKVKSVLPDLIISDIMMPVMDGFEMIKIIRKDDQVSHIPILVLSAKAELEDVQKGFNIGIDDYLLKPFDMSSAMHAIESLI